MKTIITALENIIHKYESRDFQVTDVHADSEFDKEALRHFLQPISLHVHGRVEHVGTIERST